MIEDIRRLIRELPDVVIKNTTAIFLYGSSARGDYDKDSDCDLLIIIEDCDDEQYLCIKEAVKGWHKEQKVEFAFYQMSMIKRMHKKGSYFLWHIKKEGIELYNNGTTISDLLESLPKYQGISEDFDEYTQILNDVQDSLGTGTASINFELSILAILIRNICIGCCYLNRRFEFGRRKPVEFCLNLWKEEAPFTLEEYDVVYKYRIANTRNLAIPECQDLDYANSWVQKTKQLLDSVQKTRSC